MRNRRGVVLLVVIGVLSVLSLLAIVFTYVSRMERDISRNYLDLVRATLLAQSGMERVMADMKLRIPGQESWYGGEDWNGNGNLAEVVDDQNGNYDGTLQIRTCGLQYARRPSYFADTNGDRLPELLPIREPDATGNLVTRQRGYSGMLAGTYEQTGDTYSLKVVDAQSKVWLNGTGAGFLRLYDNMGALLYGRTLGATIQAARPFAYVEDLVAKGVLSQVEFDATRDYWTASCWVDRSTIRPDPQVQLVAMPENIRRDAWIEPRAPININTADPIVIRAVLQGISGFYTDNNTPTKRLYTLDPARATNMANAIVQARAETFTDANGNGVYDAGEAYTDVFMNGRYDGPFNKWESFYRSFVGQVTGFVGNFNGWARALVYANANPNTLVNKFQPDAHVWRGMDKPDLVGYTTEFCFTSGGTYEISSLGRVTGGGGIVVAQREIRAVVSLYDVAKLTTQEDFEPRNSARGLPADVTIAPDILTLPEETSDLTTIESYTDTNADGRYSKGDAFVDSNGDGARDGPAIYDGQIALRNADPSTSAPWGDATANTTLRCLFHDSPGVNAVGPSSGADPYPSFRADIGSPASPMNPLNVGALQTNLERGTSLIKDVSGANDYSDMFPDGMFIRREKQEFLYFDSNLTLPVNQGSIGFWDKPTWNDIPASITWRDMYLMNQNFTTNPPIRGKVCYLWGNDGSPDFLILHAFWYNRTAMGGYGGYSAAISDAGMNPPPTIDSWLQKPLVSSNWNPGQWHYIAVRYTQMNRYNVWLDGNRIDGTPAGEFASYITGPIGTVTIGDPPPRYNVCELGANMPWWNTVGSGTFDDWQQFSSLVPASDTDFAPPWRYSDTGIAGYSQYQGALTLPVGSRVKRVAWTRYLPRENYRGESLSPTSGTARRRQAQVRLQHKMTFDGAWTTPAIQDGRDVDVPPPSRATAAGERFQFALTFDRNGEDPFRNAPTVDDVTVLYSVDGVHPRILSWQVLP